MPAYRSLWFQPLPWGSNKNASLLKSMVQTHTLGFQQKCQFIEVYGSNPYLGVPTKMSVCRSLWFKPLPWGSNKNASLKKSMVPTLTLGFQQKCQFIEVYGSHPYLGVPTKMSVCRSLWFKPLPWGSNKNAS